MEKKVTIKNANVLSNDVISKVSDVFLFDGSFVQNEKEAKKYVSEFAKDIAKSDNFADPIVFAYAAKVAAENEYKKQVSKRINERFHAEFVVTNLIRETAKLAGSEFFTPEYLQMLGIYEIPNGTILDTIQKCRSFVSSLYATALSEHKKEIKDGGGIEIVFARVKEIISFNDSQFIATKFAQMSILRKYELLYSVIANCTKSEKVTIWAKLGVTFKANKKQTKGCPNVGIIPIQDYQPNPNKLDINFYHEYPIKAIPLSVEEKTKVLSKPVTPLKGSKKTTIRNK